MAEKDKILVQAKHIEKGVERYNGKTDALLQRHLDDNGWNYTNFLFEDGRVMLVYPDASFGILYASKGALYADMERERRRQGQHDLDGL